MNLFEKDINRLLAQSAAVFSSEVATESQNFAAAAVAVAPTNAAVFAQTNDNQRFDFANSIEDFSDRLQREQLRFGHFLDAEAEVYIR